MGDFLDEGLGQVCRVDQRLSNRLSDLSPPSPVVALDSRPCLHGNAPHAVVLDVVGGIMLISVRNAEPAMLHE